MSLEEVSKLPSGTFGSTGPSPEKIEKPTWNLKKPVLVWFLLLRARASLPHSSLLSCLVMYPQRIRNCRVALLALLCPALKALKALKPQQASFGSIRPTPCLTFFGLLGLPCLTPAFQAAWSCLFKKFRSFGSTRPSPCLTFFGVPGPRCLTLAFSAGWSCLFKKLRNCHLALLVLLGPALKILKSLEAFKKPVLVLLGTALTSPSLACSGVLASLQLSKLPSHLSSRGFETAVWHFWFY